jgi:hypothetical protein
MNPSLPNNKTFLTDQNTTNDFFAEIVESNLQYFKAQCWQWDNFPKFGSLVQTQSNEKIIIGCVTQIETGSIDPMRSPFPYQKTEAELIAEQPQIFEFLRTIFNVQIVGYIDEKQYKINYHLAPTPCKIHSFVKECSTQLFTEFFQEPLYIHILFGALNQSPNLDELLLAILNNMATQKLLTPAMLDDFCQTFSLLTGNDYRHLKLFLKRVEKIAH